MRGRSHKSLWLRMTAAAVLLGGFWAFKHRPPTRPAPSPTAPVAAQLAAMTDPPPVAPQHWRLGKLNLVACQLRLPHDGVAVPAWCGQLRVAEDRQHPQARQITLRVAVIRAQAQVPAPDMLTLLAGGPGQAATEAWPMLANGLNELLQQRSVLLVDQRGTGGSNPLNCPTNPALADDDLVKLKAAAAACAASLASKADLRFYTTTDAVHDLEQVRQAVGGPPLDLLGISYGTRVAQQYAATYPSAVRSMVLDGVVPNPLALGQDNAVNLESALAAQAQRCRADSNCFQRFGDFLQTLHQFQQRLQAQPLLTQWRDPDRSTLMTSSLTASQLTTVARLFAYTPQMIALLPLDVDKAMHGDAAPLLAQANLISHDVGDSMNAAMATSVVCSEDVDLLRPRLADQATLLGSRFISGLQAQCSVWPKGLRPANFHQPLQTPAPVLLLSGQFDPVTPPAYAQAVAQGLPHVRSLVLQGQGHNVVLSGCMPRLLSQFIKHPDPAAIDTSCLQHAYAPAFFTTLNGAVP